MLTLNIIKKLLLPAVMISLLLMNAESWAVTKYTVKKGDSLHKIAGKFKVKTDALSRANHLDSDKLVPGTKLTIPTARHKKIRSAASRRNAAAVINEAGLRTYKVKKGDTLWKTAKKFSVNAADLMRLNNLKSGKLKAGQVLVLEEKPVSIEAAAAAPQPDPIAADPKLAEEIRELSESPEVQQSGLKDFMISVIRQTLGIPYKFGSSSVNGTDCSGYVQMVFSPFGIDIPRSAREQFKIGTPVEKEDLSIGDLVFFRTYASFPSHVGIYLGNNLFIHASSFAKKVTIQNLNMPYYLSRFIGAKRLQGLDGLSYTSLPR
ncbi:MAG: LysM peptidoglycan-binding domain-containing protein [Nitrospirota bacterium]|nr:LysM peptidoglycan-binding domain-containing protein [Nitrospirota bacterium]